MNLPLICTILASKIRETMTLKEFFSLKHNKTLWLNLLAMAFVAIGAVWGVLKGLDAYTRHGEAMVVPDVKGMSVSDAEALFRNRGLTCVVSDSTYVKTLPAGCILEYTPSAGQKVKQGRVVYLTINTLNVPLLAVPDVADNSSLRQAEARVVAAGFRLDSIKYIEGEKDWVYGIMYKGRSLGINDRVPTGAILTLVVGDGGERMKADSLSVEEPAATRQTDRSATEESWF